MKRIISLVFALVFLFTASVFVLPSSNAAGEKLNFVLTNAAGNANDEITVELQITENPGFYAFWFFLYYDSDTFILRDYTVNGELTAVGELVKSQDAMTADSIAGPIAKRVITYFPSYGVDASDKNLKILYFEEKAFDRNVTFTGTAITFTFQIMGIANDGEYSIGLVPDHESIINCDGEDVPFTWQNAVIAVGDTTVPDTEETRNPDDTVTPIPDDTDNNVTPGTETDNNNTNNNNNNNNNSNNNNNNSNDNQNKRPGSLIVETFVDEEGTTYYVDSDGDTQVFDEDAMTDPALYDTDVPETIVGEDGTTYYVDSNGETHVYDGNSSGSNGDNSANKKNMTALYIVIAAVLVLIAAAGILFAFITKTKKDDGSGAVSDEMEKRMNTGDESGDDTSDASNYYQFDDNDQNSNNNGSEE